MGTDSGAATAAGVAGMVVVRVTGIMAVGGVKGGRVGMGGRERGRRGGAEGNSPVVTCRARERERTDQANCPSVH